MSPKKPIKILYIIDTCLGSPYGSNGFTGGAEKQLYTLATSLNARKFKPIVLQLSPKGGSSEFKIKDEGVTLIQLPVSRLYSLMGLRQLRRLYNFVKEEKIDIIHTYFEKAEVMAWLVSRFADIPCWITSRRDLGFKRKNIYKMLFKISAKDCKEFIAVCEAVKRKMVDDEGMNGEKISVIYNGVEAQSVEEGSEEDSLKRELGVPDSAPIVGMIANFNFQIKGHKYFIKAASKVINMIPEAEFLLVGDGPLRKHYEIMVNDMGLEDKIHFTGARSDVLSILSGMNISVLSSESEGLSNVILESMAAGKPVIAANVGGNPELVEDSCTGILIQSGSESELAEAIAKVLLNPMVAIEMGAQGKIRAEKYFSVQTMIKKHEQLYTSIVNGSGVQGRV